MRHEPKDVFRQKSFSVTVTVRRSESSALPHPCPLSTPSSSLHFFIRLPASSASSAVSTPNVLLILHILLEQHATNACKFTRSLILKTCSGQSCAMSTMHMSSASEIFEMLCATAHQRSSPVAGVASSPADHRRRVALRLLGVAQDVLEEYSAGCVGNALKLVVDRELQAQ